MMYKVLSIRLWPSLKAYVTDCNLAVMIRPSSFKAAGAAYWLMDFQTVKAGLQPGPAEAG